MIKIENMVLSPRQTRDTPQFREFVKALAALKVGQSFVYPVVSNHRMAISIVQILFDRQFTTRKTDSGFRIGRVS